MIPNLRLWVAYGCGYSGSGAKTVQKEAVAEGERVIEELGISVVDTVDNLKKMDELVPHKLWLAHY